MKFNLIKHTDGCKRLILIFSGWSTDKDFYSHISRAGWDTGVVTDYNDCSLDTTYLDDYDTVWVFAWSLGVKMAAISLPPEKIVAAYAINGTLNPVDDAEGIPVDIYGGTTDNLNLRNLSKFQLRMSGSRDVFNKYFNKHYSDEKVESLKKELATIREIDAPIRSLPWRRAFIGKNDNIFPVCNMCNSWNIHAVELSLMDEPHYIDLQKIVDTVVPDIEYIGRRFSESNDTYLENAEAQRLISSKLSDLLKEYVKGKDGLVLELGPGKGFFTRKYAGVIHPSVVDFVDLTRLDKFGIADVENYYQGDAECFLDDAEEKKYNYVLSSSAVQWFSNFRRFIENSARIIADRGILCFSTFEKGNLSELDSFRTCPLYYHSAGEIHDLVAEYFEDIKITREVIKLEFDTPRELMMHLKLTGVGGFAPSSGVSPLKLRNTKSLTFRPVYVLARKK